MDTKSMFILDIFLLKQSFNSSKCLQGSEGKPMLAHGHNCDSESLRSQNYGATPIYNSKQNYIVYHDARFVYIVELK